MSILIKNEAARIRILHLEDSAEDAELVRSMVEADGLSCTFELATHKSAFESALVRKQFDLILCDHSLPDYDGFTALRVAQEIQPLTPVIMLSGMLDDAQAVESLKGGATDYILKQRLARLVPAIRRALREAAERAEKRDLEAAFLRAQRMESIGSLAGGIAHDLNNALAPVLMSVEQLRDCRDEELRTKFLDIIASSTQRATDMVKQILGFARGQSGTGPIHVSHIIKEMAKIVQDTFPKAISITVQRSAEGLWQIRGDSTELHQVLLNLCVNARDSMPEGGRLTLSARNIRLDALAARPCNAPPGPYVVISVADSGSGIPPEVLPRIFEPFFTTKSPDKGTGLGLSTVAAIVKRHGGWIDIRTEAGKGTEFSILLPANDRVAERPELDPEKIVLPTGHGELILVIEDEAALCELTKTTLENYGFRVVTARNGVQGIDRFEEHRHKIRLLVTDSDMPFMDGMSVIRTIKGLRPDLPVIIASGSKRGAEQMQKEEMELTTNLGKPFSVEQLLIAVGMAILN